MTAVHNPRSLLYTTTAADNTADNGNIANLYYGINCSVLGSYAHDWNYHSATNIIPELLYTEEVAPADMQLCDLPVASKDHGGSVGHCTMVTAITRNADGTIASLELTESTSPVARAVTMTYESFITTYINNQGYKVYRDNRLYEAGYKASPFVRVFDEEPTEEIVYSKLCTNRGDKVSITSDESIILNVLIDSGYESIKVYKDGTLYDKYTVTDGDIVGGDLSLTGLPTGMYTAVLCDSDGVTIENAGTSFEVCEVEASRYKNYFYFKGAYGVPVRVVFKNNGGYTLAVFDLTDDDVARGYTKIEGYTGATPAHVCVPFKTAFGFVVARFDYAVETEPDELPEEQPVRTLTAIDFGASHMTIYGTPDAGHTDDNRVYTLEPITLEGNTISIDCPSPYQYIVYFHKSSTFTEGSLVGKTSFTSGSLDDITNATLASGSLSGATHCRISLRDSTDASANLSGRIEEFANAVTVTITKDTGESGGDAPDAPTSGIPEIYQKVDYIETDGNQHIDTGVLASDHPDGISYVFEGNLTDFIGSTSANYLFGALDSGVRAGNLYIDPGLSSDEMGVFCGSTSTPVARHDSPELGKDFAVTVFSTSTANTVSATIDGQAFYRPAAVSVADMPSVNVYLFWCNGLSATSSSKKYYGKLYSFTMDAADGTAIRNFVPCYRKSDGVIGLYDTVGGQFYENVGTGAFTKGEDVV